MQRRSQKLEIVLDIQAVSCPGVWLSSRGTVYLSICLLGQHIQTRDAAPVFPLMFHEGFVVEKVFRRAFHLAELDDILEQELVYMELVQRLPLQADAVLATFETSAREFLFPNITTTPQYSGADLDLLMEPTVHFPGALSPRLEVSTKTTVKEVRTSMDRSPSRRAVRYTSPSRTELAIVKDPDTKQQQQQGGQDGQDERPPFAWRRADAALIGRQPGAPSDRRPRLRSRSLGALVPVGRGRHCHCACADRPRSASAERAPRATVATKAAARRRSRSLERPGAVRHADEAYMPPDWCYRCCAYTTHHHCAVCDAYRRYFGRNYPGHHHLNCCSCYGPVPTLGVRPIYDWKYAVSTDTDSDDSGSVSPRWPDPVWGHRHAYYRSMEDLYRRLYMQAARRARRS